MRRQSLSIDPKQPFAWSFELFSTSRQWIAKKILRLNSEMKWTELIDCVRWRTRYENKDEWVSMCELLWVCLCLRSKETLATTLDASDWLLTPITRLALCCHHALSQTVFGGEEEGESYVENQNKSGLPGFRDVGIGKKYSLWTLQLFISNAHHGPRANINEIELVMSSNHAFECSLWLSFGHPGYREMFNGNPKSRLPGHASDDSAHWKTAVHSSRLCNDDIIELEAVMAHDSLSGWWSLL